MLKARINDLYVLGLCAENIKLLQAGKPIVLSLAELGGHDDVMIMAGETIPDIVAELERATGRKMPPPTSTTTH